MEGIIPDQAEEVFHDALESHEAPPKSSVIDLHEFDKECDEENKVVE